MSAASAGSGAPGSRGTDERSQKHLQFATFHLGQDLFGINILQVQEILLKQPITAVPLAPAYVLGLIGLRGQIVTAVDLKKRIGLHAAETADDHYHLVVADKGSVASLQVDRIGDVLEIPSSQFVPPPESLDGVDRRFLGGVVMLENQMLSVIDVGVVLDTQ
jgi:purine-binding chemotaxis protein CheW